MLKASALFDSHAAKKQLRLFRPLFIGSIYPLARIHSFFVKGFLFPFLKPLILISIIFVGGCAVQYSSGNMTSYVGCMALQVENHSGNHAVKTSAQTLGINISSHKTGDSISIGYSNNSLTQVPDQGAFSFLTEQGRK